jgi:hypothetical protein
MKDDCNRVEGRLREEIQIVAHDASSCLVAGSVLAREIER